MSDDNVEKQELSSTKETEKGSRKKRAILIAVGVFLALAIIGNLLPSDEKATDAVAEATSTSQTPVTSSSEPAKTTTSQPTTTSAPPTTTAPQTTTAAPPPETTTQAPPATTAPKTTNPKSGVNAAEMEQEFLKNIPGRPIKDMCDPAYTHWACFYEGVEGKPSYLQVNLLTDGGITNTKALAKSAGQHWFNFIGCKYPDLSVIVVNINGIDNNVFRKDIPMMSNC